MDVRSFEFSHILTLSGAVTSSRWTRVVWRGAPAVKKSLAPGAEEAGGKVRLALGDVVNLHRARKARARRAAEATAGENRARFGRTKAERDRQADELERQQRHLEGHALTERDEHEKPRG
ncbi:DUF4169 family protein [Xanthobacter sp. KR7-65]|uniref:DUF4169 family protein n=1 Tax=Xanthobacter sp. KR7-65 TaxID=3156612 RepID=UPI0032B58849